MPGFHRDERLHLLVSCRVSLFVGVKPQPTKLRNVFRLFSEEFCRFCHAFVGFGRVRPAPGMAAAGMGLKSFGGFCRVFAEFLPGF